MPNGFHLNILIGPVIPTSAPKAVLDALTDVLVTNRADGSSVFQLSFKISNSSPLHILFLLSGGSSVPIFRVILTVTVNGTPNVIMDGVITDHEIKPGANGTSLLTVTGQDLSVLMDKLDFSGLPFPAMPAEGRVALLIAKYSVLGIIPAVIPSVLIDVPIPVTRIPSQQGTDLAYIKSLADEVGYVFYIEPGPKPGMNIAYWGPQIKAGVPQPALNVDMDAFTNVKSLVFNFDNSKNAIPVVYHYEELSKAMFMVPIPPVTPLNPPLGLVPPIPMQLKPAASGLPKYSLPKAIMVGLAKASQWTEAVSGKGELDVLQYGRVLKARQLVGVRGAGYAYDGLHYVRSVTHQIKKGDYKQSFELSRNGLISTLPKVPA